VRRIWTPCQIEKIGFDFEAAGEFSERFAQAF
jgi:hypothetical protein